MEVDLGQPFNSKKHRYWTDPMTKTDLVIGTKPNIFMASKPKSKPTLLKLKKLFPLQTQHLDMTLCYRILSPQLLKKLWMIKK
jgi:hypothetical protein